MEFIDLKKQQSRIRDKIDKNIKIILDHGQYILGQEVNELERILEKYVGTKHCIAVSSGTDALLISLLALDVKPGDEVIVPAFSFISTASSIKLIGASPVFVDVNSNTYNIDPAKIEVAITNKTKAIIAVSLYGQCAEFIKINKIANKYNLPVIEDGAQSFGATYKNYKSCNLSTIGTTSFFPSKPLGCYGDAGAIFINDDKLARIARQISHHGRERKHYHSRIGINGRMDTLQAAILLAKFDIFPEEIELRNSVAARYDCLLNENCCNIFSPSISNGNKSVYAQYTLQADDRDKVCKELSIKGIPTAIHYPIALNKQEAIGIENIRMPVSEAVANRVFSLPMHPYLSAEEQSIIISALAEVT